MKERRFLYHQSVPGSCMRSGTIPGMRRQDKRSLLGCSKIRNIFTGSTGVIIGLRYPIEVKGKIKIHTGETNNTCDIVLIVVF